MTENERHEAEIRSIMKSVAPKDEIIVRKAEKKEPKKAKKEEK